MNEQNTAEIIAQKTAELGGRAYYVGGYVRDRLLGTSGKDIDIEIHGISEQQLKSVLASLGEVLEIGKSFGVYGIKGLDLDIALPRTERPTGVRHRDFEVTADPYIGTKNAARRRDFTINSMMEDILTGEVTDHFGGKRDLESGVIRHVDSSTFSEDPLRVLRAAQFAARFGFSVADETLCLCSKMDLSALSGERVMLETKKALLKAEKPSVFFEILRNMGQLRQWFPELYRLIDVLQSKKYHMEGDVWTHTMMVLDNAAQRRGMVKEPVGFMFSALCHDFGKAVCTREIDGVLHSYGHDEQGIPLAEKFIKRLTSEKNLRKYVTNMVGLHMRPGQMARENSSVKAVNKLFDSSVEPIDLIQLSVCDGLGKIPRITDAEDFLMRRYAEFEEIMSKPYVMGRDLIEIGVEQGEHFSEILAYAHKLRLAGVDKESTLRQSAAYAKKFSI